MCFTRRRNGKQLIETVIETKDNDIMTCLYEGQKMQTDNFFPLEAPIVSCKHKNNMSEMLISSLT